MKIYVASSWRNSFQETVVKALRKEGHQVYDFKNPDEELKGFAWSDIDPNWQQWQSADYIQALQHPLAIRGFNNDFLAMNWADAFVLVQPCGRSAHLEAGWAMGRKKPTAILLNDDIEPELMFKLADYICIDLTSLKLWAQGINKTISNNNDTQK